ncbi:MAG: hypothetical protein A2Y62_03415 [Candidatus Fischerbacteria bacterium RBG_13_37_8]|uniref:GIY-YIG domain-containing protein n=1 Tax=Candidatus Fischerbacteria bacterium RBG_13_37_8 TaxID=1817863 RepID=A0A1F5VJU1_9BACT|nr:MAG: hypothetical protein A2Y62_03415 [Candidatus Fischerbacteria bacterium RBG_13_37_8]
MLNQPETGEEIGASLALDSFGALANIEAKGTHCVYRARDAEGITIYIGRTKDFARRSYEHAKRFKIEVIEGLESLTEEQAKWAEEALIVLHRLKKEGGTLWNKIHGRSRLRPDYDDQLQKAQELIKNVEY